MLGVKWLTAKVCPIGVDFGAESLKMVQLGRDDGELHIVASGQKDVPDSVASDPAARTRFLAEAVRELMTRCRFKGRRVITAVPSVHLFVQHTRVVKMSEQDLAKALPWEAQGKLPFPVRDALLRHLVAGDLFVDNEAKSEVILMAAPRLAVENHLAALARCKLEVQAVLVPPLAIIEAFRFLFTRNVEKDMCTFFVDIGAAQSTAMITHSTQVVFVKQVPVGGQAINTAVATQLNVARSQVRRMRMDLARAENGIAASAAADVRGAPAAPPPRVAVAQPAAAAAAAPRLGAGTSPASTVLTPVVEAVPAATASQKAVIETVAREQVERLAAELTCCVRYYQSLFPNRPIDRLVFLGGEAHHRSVCQQIAKALHLPAQLGDPMLRLHRTHQDVPCGDLVAGVAAPEWAVAFGCSLAEAESAGK